MFKIIFKVKNLSINDFWQNFIIELIHKINENIKVFVFCFNINSDLDWTKIYKKICCATNSIQQLISVLKQQRFYYYRKLSEQEIKYPKLNSGHLFNSDQSFVEYIYIETIIKLVLKSVLLFMWYK